MQKLIGIAVQCSMMLALAGAAWGSEGHALPWGDFFLRLLNFAIFIGIIWYAAGKLIKRFFAKSREDVVNEMQSLAQKKKDAEARLAEVEERISGVEAECEKILAEGRDQAERMKKQILADAQVQADRIVEQAKRLAEQQGKAELDSLRGRMADAIVAQVEQKLAETLDKDKHMRLIDKSLSKVVLQ